MDGTDRKMTWDELAKENARLREDLKEASEAARTCWKTIYDAGTNPISDDSCSALSSRWFWLEAIED